MATQVEETMKRIRSLDGVIGIVVVNNMGIPIKSTFDNSTSVQYAGLVQQLIRTSKSVIKEDDPSDDLTFLRLRTKKHEICVIPETQYVMIVVHCSRGSRTPM